MTYWIKNKKYRVDRAVVAYISKESAIVKVFKVFVTEELLKEVNDWWDSIREFFNKKELPPVLEKDTPEHKKFCVNFKCTYYNRYCFGDPIEMEENIKELVWQNVTPKKIENV